MGGTRKERDISTMTNPTTTEFFTMEGCPRLGYWKIPRAYPEEKVAEPAGKSACLPLCKSDGDSANTSKHKLKDPQRNGEGMFEGLDPVFPVTLSIRGHFRTGSYVKVDGRRSTI
jgi:hypothetical protein